MSQDVQHYPSEVDEELDQIVKPPSGWQSTTLGEIADVQGGITKGKQRTPSHKLREVPYLRVANVQRGFLDLGEVKTIEATEDEVRQFQLRAGDVLFNEGGDRDKLGRGWIWSGEIAECIHQNHVFRARIHGGVLVPKLLSWYGNSEGQAYFLREGKQTTNLASLNSTTLRALPVLIPPGPEQHRTVAAIESYFTRLDDAVTTLERVERNLKRYRASVLKSAVEGRLVPTEAALAKQEGRDYEPAFALLERILTERRRRWAESGKKGKYDEPALPDTTSLPELPEGWCWATVDMFADVKGGVAKGQQRKKGTELREVPYLRVANVQRGYLDMSEIKTISATEDEIVELRLKPGDVLFNEGGDRDKLGRGWIWADELPECIHQNHVFRARLLTDDIQPRYLSWYGNGSGQSYFFDQGKQTTNLASINLTKLKGLPVPIPPSQEQIRIVVEAERLLSVTNSCMADVKRTALRGQSLYQSILKWAFEGKLADQDPSDEPASVLLARIKAERDKTQPAKRKSRA